jgi:hypothetical protein
VPRTQADLTSNRANWWFIVTQMIAFATGLLLTLPSEVGRFKEAAGTKVGLLAWIFEINLDTTLPLVLLAVAPVLWFVRRRSDREAVGLGVKTTSALPTAWMMAVACLLTSIAASAWIASYEVGAKPPMRFGVLPPAYHDEFSYLFQAKTFLAGRLSFPSSPRIPELFDQMHVVNEGRFASRYFPGVGLWIAPFLATGHPYWAEWLAGGLAAFFIFWAGRELAGNGVGLTAGLLTALSPGMGLFSNLLLSHEPTMAALALFLFAFLRWMRTARPSDACWAGCGLSFAMLCRPMTAAGFALPFGLLFAWRLMRDLARSRRQQPENSPVSAAHGLRQFAALAAPLAIGLGALFLYDKAITGNGFLSPYQLYTDTYTPRHVYGFNNVVRGEQHPGPKVLDNYDRWADNLTPQLAFENVAKRSAASVQWTLGTVPLAMAVVVFVLAALWRVDPRWRFVAAAVLTLHAVHVPYWFVGIMNWHYVFETGPLLLLIFAVTSQQLLRCWRESRRVLMPAWWAALIATAVVTNWLPFDPFWSLSRVDRGVEEITFARLHYAGFQRMIDQAVTRRPALLLIEGDPADRSLDYVVNDPDLTAPVLRGRYRPGKTDLAQVRSAFPDRTLYLYQVKTGQLKRVASGE